MMTAQPTPENVAFWELNPNSEGHPVPVRPSVQPCISTAGIVDLGIFGERKDIRHPVKDVDFEPDGKYHSILKLFFWFEDSATWITATGWLLKEDLVVTAGHCVYNDNQRATCIKACIGYSARPKSTNLYAGDERFVKRVVVPLEWIDSQSENQNVAFLQLNGPFGNATPFVYNTPETNARQQFTIVGYPTDLNTGEEPGGEMYEMKISRDVNLENTKWNMLVYQGDFQGGFSGAPVIRDSDFAAIGVHVRGGSFNSALVIGGPYGVSFHVYEKVAGILDKGGADSTFETKTDTEKNWLKYLTFTV